jgi:hypothetical protein
MEQNHHKIIEREPIIMQKFNTLLYIYTISLNGGVIICKNFYEFEGSGAIDIRKPFTFWVSETTYPIQKIKINAVCFEFQN